VKIAWKYDVAYLYGATGQLLAKGHVELIAGSYREGRRPYAEPLYRWKVWRVEADSWKTPDPMTGFCPEHFVWRMVEEQMIFVAKERLAEETEAALLRAAAEPG